MAIGVNYGAFSLAFSASLAGMLWRDILGRKHIRVGGLEFARVNLPIIAITMVVGLTVLIGQIYIMRGTYPYNSKLWDVFFFFFNLRQAVAGRLDECSLAA
jgi:hypothetical protein